MSGGRRSKIRSSIHSSSGPPNTTWTSNWLSNAYRKREQLGAFLAELDEDLGEVPKKVIAKGINMTIYIEGKRSFDGKLLPFKKGPFYLAMECGVPVVPMTIVGTHYAMPKGKFAIKTGKVQVIFHDPIEPKDFIDRDHLMDKVRAVIEGGLPEEYRQERPITTENPEVHRGKAQQNPL